MLQHVVRSIIPKQRGMGPTLVPVPPSTAHWFVVDSHSRQSMFSAARSTLYSEGDINPRVMSDTLPCHSCAPPARSHIMTSRPRHTRPANFDKDLPAQIQSSESSFLGNRMLESLLVSLTSLTLLRLHRIHAITRSGTNSATWPLTASTAFLHSLHRVL